MAKIKKNNNKKKKKKNWFVEHTAILEVKIAC